MLCVWKVFLSAWQEYLHVSIVTSKEEINEIKFSRFTGEYKSAKHWCLYMTATLAGSVGVTVTLCEISNTAELTSPISRFIVLLKNKEFGQ